jgi:hypothetical protein
LALLGITGCADLTPVTMRAAASGHTVDLSLDGANLGRRSATIRLSGAGPVTKVTVTTVMPRMNMTGPLVEATRVGPGTYQAGGEFFSMIGNWRLDVHIDGTPPGTASFMLRVLP